jgi:hypothetical protein
MAAKREYKILTKAQTASVKRYTKKGKTQGQIAKLLGVSKQRVSTAQRAAKVGKRRPSPFWSEVKKIKEATGRSHKESTTFVYNAPKWGKKRHGAGYLTPEQRGAAMRAKRAEFMGDKLSKGEKQQMAEYGEEIGLGDTPK